jgi:putative endonuclease
MALHNDLGKEGEKIAYKYLLREGYKILETNWRFGKAEIDIIAQKNNTLVVIEVKTRSSEHYGKPEIFVNKKKMKLLLEAINQYVEIKNIDDEIRFDIISVIINQYRKDIEHIENAFIWF